MPANTPNRGLPYPVSTDPLTGFPSLMQTAMSMLDQHTHTGYAGIAYRTAAGITSVSCSNGTGTGAVNLSVGGFTLAPIVLLTVHQGSGNWNPFIQGTITTSGFSIGVKHISSSTASATLDVHWYAIQMRATANGGIPQG